jgi:hypothetical protein
MFKSKGIAESIVEKFGPKPARERDEKPDWKEAGLSKEGQGGGAGSQDEDMDNEGMHAVASDMIDAFHNKDAKALHGAMSAYHDMRDLQASKKDVDNGPVSDEKDSKHVAIAGDEYK